MLCRFSSATLLLLLPMVAEAAQKKPVVAVFSIEVKGVRVTRSVAASLTTYLASKLSESGHYQVVPQDMLKRALQDKKKESYKRCYAQSCQIEIGKEVSAGKALSTQVMKLGSKCLVVSNLYDLKTATSSQAATVKGTCGEDGLITSIDELVKKLTGRQGPVGPKVTATPKGPTPTASAIVTPAAATGKAWVGMLMKQQVGRVVVLGCWKRTPAYQAGMRPGDVLSRLNGAPVTSMKRVVAFFSAQRPGSKVDLWIERAGRQRRLVLTPVDQSEIPRISQQACTEGAADACVHLGRLYLSGGFGLPKDRQRALTLFSQGCQAGDAEGCRLQGWVHHQGGRGIPIDLVKAVALYDKACRAGNDNGCASLGQMYARGAGGVAKNMARAMALYRKACQRGSAWGCWNLGALFRRSDTRQAVALFRKACQGGDAGGCFELARMYEWGQGVAKDRQQAVVFYRKACKARPTLGCKDLKRLGFAP